MEFIDGDSFKKVADFVYAPGIRHGEDYDNLQNTLDLDSLRDRDIIYTHTFYVKELFRLIKNHSKQVIIITHNSDQNIDGSFIVPDNVIKWYAQNVNVIHPKIKSIPIGIENDRWFKELNKRQVMTDKMSEAHHIKNLVYMNHNPKTNFEKRGFLYEMFGNESWVTVKVGQNGIDFDKYINNLHSHLFVICPQGNGMDTHRTWESLYMDAIPIEQRNNNNASFENMPILLIDEWGEVNEKFLLDKWPELYCKKKTEKLNFAYWKEKIMKTKYSKK
jgi:hypothetical protein